MTQRAAAKLRAVLGVVVSLSWACEETTPPSAPNARSQAVRAAPGAVATPAATATPKPVGQKKPRAPLCRGQMEKAPRELPTQTIASSDAEEGSSAATFVPQPGRYTWLNLWAAWCLPCKEEIPRLLGWQKKLRDAGVPFDVEFLSMDDDSRQLQSFLKSQPADGLRSTYWLKEGAPRTDWLTSLGLDPDPELPGHLLIDTTGQVRCFVQGAVEDEDFPSLHSLLKP
ncbi:MAG: hypothetical protein RJA70_1949 [Pseudomonadota bacterium]|jgi:thiol-disulfide isomerase/thioredoxin